MIIDVILDLTTKKKRNIMTTCSSQYAPLGSPLNPMGTKGQTLYRIPGAFCGDDGQVYTTYPQSKYTQKYQVVNGPVTPLQVGTLDNLWLHRFYHQ